MLIERIPPLGHDHTGRDGVDAARDELACERPDGGLDRTVDPGRGYVEPRLIAAAQRDLRAALRGRAGGRQAYASTAAQYRYMPL